MKLSPLNTMSLSSTEKRFINSTYYVNLVRIASFLDIIELSNCFIKLLVNFYSIYEQLLLSSRTNALTPNICKKDALV